MNDSVIADPKILYDIYYKSNYHYILLFLFSTYSDKHTRTTNNKKFII